MNPKTAIPPTGGPVSAPFALPARTTNDAALYCSEGFCSSMPMAHFLAALALTVPWWVVPAHAWHAAPGVAYRSPSWWPSPASEPHPVPSAGGRQGQRRAMARANARQDVDIIAAIERCGTYVDARRGYRVTASDVAAAGGYEIASARSALTLLATAVRGAMEVTNDGEVVFVFPRDSRRILRNSRSPRARLFARGRDALTLLAKAVFGLGLLASFALVRPLVSAASGVEEGSGGRASGSPPRVSLRDEVACLRASLRAQPDAPPGPSVADDSLVMACFSFLFGGHNPNARLEDEQMAAVANAIRDNRGTVTVEQVAPFLIDTAATRAADAAGGSVTVDACMLPLLGRFEGRPHAVEGGHLVYRFPDLLTTTAPLAPQPPALVKKLRNLLKWVNGPVPKDYLEEKRIAFMPPVHRRQLRRVLMVVGVNYLGCLLLGAALGPLQVSLRMTGSTGALLAINAAYGLMLANSLGFVLIPALRAVRLVLANRAIAERNAQRWRHAQALLQPSRELRCKLNAAQALGYRTEPIRDSDVSYTTAKSVDEQGLNPQMEAWDRALLRRSAP